MFLPCLNRPIPLPLRAYTRTHVKSWTPAPTPARQAVALSSLPHLSICLCSPPRLLTRCLVSCLAFRGEATASLVSIRPLPTPACMFSFFVLPRNQSLMIIFSFLFVLFRSDDEQKEREGSQRRRHSAGEGDRQHVRQLHGIEVSDFVFFFQPVRVGGATYSTFHLCVVSCSALLFMFRSRSVRVVLEREDKDGSGGVT